MTFDPTSVEVLCVTLPKDHCVPVPWKKHQSMRIQWPQSQSDIKVCGYSDIKVCGYSDPQSHICWGLMCDSTQGSLCPSPMKIHQSMRIQWPFLQKTWTRGSLTPRWPLTPHLLRSRVCLYPRIIMSKSHGNTSMYVDTVINFVNYQPKVIDP